MLVGEGRDGKAALRFWYQAENAEEEDRFGSVHLMRENKRTRSTADETEEQSERNNDKPEDVSNATTHRWGEVLLPSSTRDRERCFQMLESNNIKSKISRE
jgi:hypothetical protein